jgi:hypothetical protein
MTILESRDGFSIGDEVRINDQYLFPPTNRGDRRAREYLIGRTGVVSNISGTYIVVEVDNLPVDLTRPFCTSNELVLLSVKMAKGQKEALEAAIKELETI